MTASNSGGRAASPVGWQRSAAALALALVVVLARQLGCLPADPSATPPSATGEAANASPDQPAAKTRAPTADTPGKADRDDADLIRAATRSERSGFMVEIPATVDRLLADDDEGSPHQRFIVRLSNGLTVLVAHNLDLAERVPARSGDALRVVGQYEWNDRGGVIHWTHDDPGGRRQGGRIEHAGTIYE